MLLINLLLWILSLSKKEDIIMAIVSVYVSLILKGKKTVAQVPVKIRKQAVEMLIDIESPEELYADYVDENGNIVIE